MRIKKTIAIISLLMLLFCGKHSNAQSFTNGLHLGIKGGTSKLLGESGGDISGLLNEFDNSYAPAFDLELARYLGSHVELGFEVGSLTLKGESYDPQFSAEGVHASMSPSIDYPVEYQNKLLHSKLFASYYFRDLSKEGKSLHLNPFVRAGAGILIYRGTVQYIDPAHGGVIFGKGVGEFSEWSMTTFVYSGAAGIKASISPKLSLMATAVFNYVNYDFLDVVHNYAADGQRLFLSGLYSEFKVGIFYNFDSIGDSTHKKSKDSSGKKSSRGNKTTNPHLPFAAVH